jgi:cation diffusion facilitator CzcD-associated flavoprotein CzcO
MSEDLEVAIVGAGPYGLSAAVHLARAGVDAQVFGECMSFWEGMPRGMKLRSNWSATNIGEPEGELSLRSYQADTGDSFHTPVPLERFVAYGKWFQRRGVPHLDERRVRSLSRARRGFELELADGQRLTARRVAVACGIDRFASVPSAFEGLPEELVSHTGHFGDGEQFRGRRVAVIGGGQSALECAALASEVGAQVDVFIRQRRVVWLKGYSVKNTLGPLGPVVYAPTDVGPLWYSRLVAMPDIFRRLPRRAQDRIAYRSIRPACSHWVRVRLDDVRMHLGTGVKSAAQTSEGVQLDLDGGGTWTCDHVLLGTGYRPDIASYAFLDRDLLRDVRRSGGYPVLRRGLESSVPGLHFMGAPAAWSFGPTMRFVSGSWYAGRALTSSIAGRRRRR